MMNIYRNYEEECKDLRREVAAYGITVSNLENKIKNIESRLQVIRHLAGKTDSSEENITN